MPELDYTKTGDPVKDSINRAKAQAVEAGLNPQDKDVVAGFIKDNGVHTIYAPVIRFNGVQIITGKDSPLNVVAAPLGSLYLNQNTGVNTGIYIKQTETVEGDKTGWVALVAQGSVLSTNAVNGHLFIPTCAGIPAGAAATGALILDSTNNKVYVRSGGNWVALN